MNAHMDPFDIARRLLEFAARVEAMELTVSVLPVSQDEQVALRQEFGVADRYAGPAEEMIGSLQEALEDSGWNPDVSGIPQTERDRWTFGTAITLRGAPNPILRGFVQPLQREPILRRVPDRVALYLITLDGGEDYLARESHGMGKHYHYLNWRKERSNVILSWDTRWKEPNPQTKPPMLRALFVEAHGERSNAGFVARPDLWGVKKRATMHEACVPDLAKWPITEFKCAANKSEAVFPLGRTLTPHPDAIVAAVAKAAASAKKIKNRRR
jgi:hypothetical protein